MKKQLLAVALAAAVLTLASCTDAERAAWGALGSKSTITCYSGGKVILTDESTGKVASSEHGAGIYYKSDTTGRLVHNYADCIVEQE